MRCLPTNLDALLVELDDLPQTLALLASLQTEPIAGVEEIVPAARTLLIRFRPSATSPGRLAAELARRDLSAQAAATDSPLVEIPVDYRGEDLNEVARLLGITPEEVIRRHTGSDYTVAFTGFAPGFAYLSGGARRGLDVPRRATPRTRIPAGAVALAGAFSGVYPQASPGGWQIIGVTDTPMWDLNRAVPALLQPGFRVRFVDIAAASPAGLPLPLGEGRGEGAQPAQAPPAAHHPSMAREEAERAVLPLPLGEGQGEGAPDAILDITGTGLQALWQDAGRHGLAGQGVSAAGAMDQRALRGANRLVGNRAGAACIEVVGGGFEFVCHGDAVAAVTGADGPLRLTTAGGRRRAVSRDAAFALADGDRLSIAAPRAGLRSYLALRGGFDVVPVLGSCSTDTLAQVGPPPIAAGDRLTVRPPARGAAPVGSPEQPPADLPGTDGEVVLDIVLGPRTDWFTAEAVARLAAQSWTVTPQSNRIGLRLQGDEPLARAEPAELPSEGCVHGAIQVPASGQPVLFLADHPLTGGYPVIGAVVPRHLDRAGQIPIGARLRFNPIGAFAAVEAGD